MLLFDNNVNKISLFIKIKKLIRVATKGFAFFMLPYFLIFLYHFKSLFLLHFNLFHAFYFLLLTIDIEVDRFHFLFHNKIEFKYNLIILIQAQQIDILILAYLLKSIRKLCVFHQYIYSFLYTYN